MENDFFELYESQELLCLEVGHNSVADWNVIVYDREGRSIGDANQVVHVQDSNRKQAFAEAYVKLAEWLCEAKADTDT